MPNTLAPGSETHFISHINPYPPLLETSSFFPMERNSDGCNSSDWIYHPLCAGTDQFHTPRFDYFPLEYAYWKTCTRLRRLHSFKYYRFLKICFGARLSVTYNGISDRNCKWSKGPDDGKFALYPAKAGYQLFVLWAEAQPILCGFLRWPHHLTSFSASCPTIFELSHCWTETPYGERLETNCPVLSTFTRSNETTYRDCSPAGYFLNGTANSELPAGWHGMRETYESKSERAFELVQNYTFSNRFIRLPYKQLHWLRGRGWWRLRRLLVWGNLYTRRHALADPDSQIVVDLLLLVLHLYSCIALTNVNFSSEMHTSLHSYESPFRFYVQVIEKFSSIFYVGQNIYWRLFKNTFNIIYN